MIPAPRSPGFRAGSFSMIRTGTPFLVSVSAATRPEGPEPTCTTILAIDHRKFSMPTHNEDRSKSHNSSRI